MRRVFISFDYDNDFDLKSALVGQAKYPDSPFEIADWSVKEPFTGNWEAKVKERIKATSLTLVICGHKTHTAKGVAVELRISRLELGKPYFLLSGRKDHKNTKPKLPPHCRQTKYKTGRGKTGEASLARQK